jgi:hypothetical protein
MRLLDLHARLAQVLRTTHGHDRAQSPDCDWQPLQVALLLMMLTLHI